MKLIDVVQRSILMFNGIYTMGIWWDMMPILRICPFISPSKPHPHLKSSRCQSQPAPCRCPKQVFAAIWRVGKPRAGRFQRRFLVTRFQTFPESMNQLLRLVLIDIDIHWGCLLMLFWFRYNEHQYKLFSPLNHAEIPVSLVSDWQALVPLKVPLSEGQLVGMTSTKAWNSCETMIHQQVINFSWCRIKRVLHWYCSCETAWMLTVLLCCWVTWINVDHNWP